MEECSKTPSQGIRMLRSLMEDANVLRRRMELLDGPDRALASMYLEYGASCRQIASLTCLDEVTIARRLKRILKRLQREGRIPAATGGGNRRMEARIAREYLVRGRSQKAVAAMLGCTRYAVQKVLSAFRQASTSRRTRNRNNRPPRSQVHDSIS